MQYSSETYSQSHKIPQPPSRSTLLIFYRRPLPQTRLAPPNLNTVFPPPNDVLRHDVEHKLPKRQSDVSVRPSHTRATLGNLQRLFKVRKQVRVGERVWKHCESSATSRRLRIHCTHLGYSPSSLLSSHCLSPFTPSNLPFSSSDATTRPVDPDFHVSVMSNPYTRHQRREDLKVQRRPIDPRFRAQVSVFVAI